MVYEMKGRIRFSETGRDSHLTLPGLLNYFQDCSAMQSEDAGIGVDYLAQNRIVWVLSFWQVDINRYPRIGDQVRVCTVPYEFKGALGSRNYSMETETGETLAVANTLYTLLHLDKHVPVRPDENMIAGYPLGEKLNMEYLSRKISFTGEAMECDPITISQHHIDTNDHVNNVQYVSMAADLLPREVKVNRILASYHISAVLGDVLYPVIYRGDESYGVDLRNAEGKSFCKVLFRFG
ncbi:MAG: acyl-[acyl-carrier-protein] thioesterase [Lachnospiraceae bacterium]|nr:acyl-[acyl-carrier-protein] thioesterase [Lachnospiraceae bacterium]